MITNSQLSTTELNKKRKTMKTKIKQITRRGTESEKHHMESLQWGGGGEEWRGKVQVIRSIIGRHKIDGERLRMA